MKLERRPAMPGDIPWLLQLRRTTMDPHLAATGASTAEAHHRERLMDRFECAQVLLEGGRPVGLLKLCRDGGEWHLVQIQLVPELQGQGIGGALLREVIDEARAANAALKLTVLKANPARMLYERLGFVTEGESEFQYAMRLSPRA